MYRQHNIISSVVENETHVLLDCDLYTDIRHSLYEKALQVNNNFAQLGSSEKLRI